MTYTAVTFAPVQSFIRASRKLRDLYGSSLLLSHLARAIALDAEARELEVISPAAISSSRGVPNVLVIKGDYRKGHARDALLTTWRHVLDTCRKWLEQALEGDPIAPSDWEQSWGPSWRASGLHTWELFHGQGASIRAARQALAINKLQRDWSMPNWTGESSTLSSTEAAARPRMGEVRDPRELVPGEVQQETRAFMAALRRQPHLGEAFAAPEEELSLVELVKRLVTYPAITKVAFDLVAQPPAALAELLPQRFQKLSTSQEAESIIWFLADGDRVGQHLETLGDNLKAKGMDQADAEARALSGFSAAMRAWAAGLYRAVPQVEQLQDKAMVVYAGGDDLFGALHESEPGSHDLQPDHLWHWLASFPELWHRHGQTQLTVSMGLVWADRAVPQREALQHVRDAEASAKARGRNRFALRLLYAGGNHLEWTCPWGWQQAIRGHYRDREGRTGELARWRHLADDLSWLASRQAIGGPHGAAVAKGLWASYFPGWMPPEPPEAERGFDAWLLDLGLVMAALETKQLRHHTARQEVTA